MPNPANVRNPIEPNEQAILALHRVSTGSSVHDTNGLIHTYRLCCLLGDPDMVQQAEREMYRLACSLAAQNCSDSILLNTRRRK
jgi:hypothetical protein